MHFQKRLDKDKVKTPPKHSAKNYGCWLLGQREYSSKRLREKLLEKGYPVEQTDEALIWLKAQGFQSDARFAEMKIRELSSRYSNRVIRSKLILLGISEEVANQKLSEMMEKDSAENAQKTACSTLFSSSSIDSEQSRANKLIQKYKNIEMDLKQKQKVYRFLASKGFSSKTISEAFKSLAQSFDEFEPS